MNTINPVEFFRLRAIADDMISKKLITIEEANAFLAKTGYVKISDTEYQAPDGSSHSFYDFK